MRNNSQIEVGQYLNLLLKLEECPLSSMIVFKQKKIK